MPDERRFNHEQDQSTGYTSRHLDSISFHTRIAFVLWQRSFELLGRQGTTTSVDLILILPWITYLKQFASTEMEAESSFRPVSCHPSSTPVGVCGDQSLLHDDLEPNIVPEVLDHICRTGAKRFEDHQSPPLVQHFHFRSPLR